MSSGGQKRRENAMQRSRNAMQRSRSIHGITYRRVCSVGLWFAVGGLQANILPANNALLAGSNHAVSCHRIKFSHLFPKRHSQKTWICVLYARLINTTMSSTDVEPKLLLLLPLLTQYDIVRERAQNRLRMTDEFVSPPEYKGPAPLTTTQNSARYSSN